MSIQAHRVIASTPIGADLIGGAGLFVDIMVVVLAAGAVSFVNGRKWLAASVAITAFLPCAAYSTSTIVGFRASELIASYATVSHNNRASEQAVKDRNDRAIRDRTIVFVQDQIRTEKRVGHKEALTASLRKLADEPVTPEPGNTETVMAYPGAVGLDELAGYVGVDVLDLLLGKTVALALLLVLGKLLCFGLGAALWSSKTVTQSASETVTGPASTLGSVASHVAEARATAATALSPVTEAQHPVAVATVKPEMHKMIGLDVAASCGLARLRRATRVRAGPLDCRILSDCFLWGRSGPVSRFKVLKVTWSLKHSPRTAALGH